MADETRKDSSALTAKRGGLTGSFDSATGVEKDPRELHQRVVAGNASLIETNSANHDTLARKEGKKSEKDRDKRFWEKVLMDLALRDYLRALDMRIDELNVLLDSLRSEIGENNKRMSDIDEDLRAIAEMRQAYENGDDIEDIGVDENSTLKNKRLEKLLKQYEERTGKKVDRNDSFAIYSALTQQQTEIEARRKEIEEENKQKENLLKDITTERDELIKEKERVQNRISAAIENDDPQSLDSVIDEAPESIKKQLLQRPDISGELREQLQKQLEEQKQLTTKEKERASFSFGDPQKIFAQAASGEQKPAENQIAASTQEKISKPVMIN